MSQISLKDYAAEIAQQIQAGEIEKAISHCRYLLDRYPMYLPAYRLLGKACLEKGDYAHASHFFQAVLSADPEDADAWMRLSVLSDDLGELEQAAWLMERAFEIRPGSSEIRNQLRQLYSRRDGIDRTRIKLTRGALARMYIKGGFYKRAISELEKLLGDKSGLASLHVAYLEVAFAQALWNTEGLSPMAATISESLLEKMPNCLKANLILGQVRWSVGEEQGAEPCFRTALALDPEGYVAYELFGERSPIPVTDVQIEYLEQEAQVTFAGPSVQTEVDAEDLSWLDRVGEITQPEPGLESSTEQVQEMPDWLQAWPREGKAEEARGVEEPIELEVEPEDQKESSTPEWLVDLQTQQDQEPVAPSWLRDIQDTEATGQEDDSDGSAEPDWLAGVDMEEIVSDREQGPEPTVVDELVGEVDSADGEETPDWLMALQPDSDVEDAAEPYESSFAQNADRLHPADTIIHPADEAYEEGIPDWLQELQPDEEDEGEVKEPSFDAMETPEPGSITADQSREEGTLPDWLRVLEPEVEEEVEEFAVDEFAVPAAAEAVEEDEIPDWLREPELEAEEEEETFAVDELEVPAAAEAEAVEEGEIPAWLRELEPEAEEEAFAVDELE
ncbi:MAG: tetratricopeptide repeat protein, partial [Anaerolineae bacterium]|nr:tetratricopeptide repeat protein [Anaerolineae bacterium]